MGTTPPSHDPPAGPQNVDGPEGPRAAPPEIVAESVRKSFGDRMVLRDIDVTIRAGDMTAIVGASGSGKTVLLDHLTGLMVPDSGRVLVADHSQPVDPPPLVDINAIGADRLDEVRLHWSIVFQRNALFSGSVFDNVALWLREHAVLPAEQIEGRVRESLAAAALDVGDVIFKDRDALSGGMAKRVAIARAIAMDPIVLFYDEPTTGLDPVVSGQIHELIFNTHHRPPAGGGVRTSIIITHDKDLLRRVSPRIIMLDEGRVLFDGSYEAFRAAALPEARAYLEAMPVLHARHPYEAHEHGAW